MSEQRTGFKVTPTPRPGESELAWYEWLMLFGVIVAAVLLCALGGRQLLKARPGSSAVVIAPTTRPLPTRTPAATATPTITPTPVPTLTPTPGVIGVGAFVQVVDAGPQGLSYRKDPGLQGQKLKYLPEGTVLRVIDGPTNVDGLKWWKLQSRTDANDVGWAAADYLQMTNP
jgi:hypothetical protein